MATDTVLVWNWPSSLNKFTTSGLNCILFAQVKVSQRKFVWIWPLLASKTFELSFWLWLQSNNALILAWLWLRLKSNMTAAGLRSFRRLHRQVRSAAGLRYPWTVADWRGANDAQVHVIPRAMKSSELPQLPCRRFQCSHTVYICSSHVPKKHFAGSSTFGKKSSFAEILV